MRIYCVIPFIIDPVTLDSATIGDHVSRPYLFVDDPENGISAWTKIETLLAEYAVELAFDLDCDKCEIDYTIRHTIDDEIREQLVRFEYATDELSADLVGLVEITIHEIK